MRTTKIAVVNRMIYPVALPGGQHLPPGEVSIAPMSDELQATIDRGLLGIAHLDTSRKGFKTKKTVEPPVFKDSEENHE